MSPLNFANLVSTHIRGQGHAVFQLRDGGVELKRCSGEETEVNRAWITRTRLVAEGLPAQPYIHLDIRTPFGESVDDGQVEAALAESLGTRKDRYSRGGWHIQFVEDTNLGSNHRVFVDLKDSQSDGGSRPGMDAAMPLELAVEALAETLQARAGETGFQLLVGGTSQCFSVLYVNGSPFHLLRVPEGAGEAAAARLIRHRDFPQSQGKGGGFRTFLCPDDPLLQCEAVRRLSPETVDFNLRLPQGEGSPKATPSLFMHLGLALAASRRDLAAHNRVQDEDRLRNQNVRGRFRFGSAMAAALLLCLLAAGGYALAIRAAGAEAAALASQAAAYRSQVDAIRALRRERAAAISSLDALRAVWNAPVPWDRVLAMLAGALPAQSGIDGLAVNKDAEGVLTLSFRAWVRDWDQVRGIERKLSESRFLEAVSISEQRKDIPTGVVVFHVACRMRRN